MKSPLVDALRLASGQDKAANNEQPSAAETAVPEEEVAKTEALPVPGDQPEPHVPELSHP